jgi:hypothetical protein
MAFLGRYGNVQPSQSDQLTDAGAMQYARAIDEMVQRDRKQDRDFLVEVVLGAAKVIAISGVRRA